MRNRVEKIISALANFVLAFLVICAVSAAPIHAATMPFEGMGGEASVSTPCPMTMQGHGHHGSGDAESASNMMGDMSCCLVQALDGARRDAAPVRLTVPVVVEALSDLRSALSDPDVDLQPPRG